MTYTYYFLTRPETIDLPGGYSTVRVHREPYYSPHLRCDVYGHVVYPRPLTAEEQDRYALAGNEEVRA